MERLETKEKAVGIMQNKNNYYALRERDKERERERDTVQYKYSTPTAMETILSYKSRR